MKRRSDAQGRRSEGRGAITDVMISTGRSGTTAARSSVAGMGAKGRWLLALTFRGAHRLSCVLFMGANGVGRVVEFTPANWYRTELSLLFNSFSTEGDGPNEGGGSGRFDKAAVIEPVREREKKKAYLCDP